MFYGKVDLFRILRRCCFCKKRSSLERLVDFWGVKVYGQPKTIFRYFHSTCYKKVIENPGCYDTKTLSKALKITETYWKHDRATQADLHRRSQIVNRIGELTTL